VIVFTKEKELDEEWVELIKESQMLGISVSEIRDFLNKNRP
jgi:DNA-binding transcriptional MerR regulator